MRKILQAKKKNIKISKNSEIDRDTLIVNFIKCNMCVRFWKISLHAAGDLRPDLHGHGDWRDDTLICASSGAMRSADGLHRKGLANCLSYARSVFRCYFLKLNQ